MKTIYFYTYTLATVLAFAFTFTSCSDTFDYEHPEVALFVKQLKAGNYTTESPDGLSAMPRFTTDHIDGLLRYADDLTVIPAFPLAPVSYTAGGKLRLGECILWTVETIRLGHNASMGCKMVHTEADDYQGKYFLTDEEVLDAASRYRHWWETRNRPQSVWTIDPCRDEPLCGSGYMWW